MDVSNMTLEEKLKLVRIGKDTPIPFKCRGVEYQGRKLDWLESLQIEAEVKSMLHLNTLDLTQPDQWIYMRVCMLNKAIFVPPDKPIPDWLVEMRKDGGIEFLREFYGAYEDAVHPPVSETPEKKETTGDEQE